MLAGLCIIAVMKHIAANIKRSISDAKKTERGELMKYFIGQINPGRVQDSLPPLTMGRMGKILEKIPTKDLYYLKRVCDDSIHFSKKFWWLLNPKNHTEDTTSSFGQNIKKNSHPEKS